MIFNLKTVLTACIFVSVFIVTLYFILKRTNIIKYLGPEPLIFVMIILIVRMGLPFEFPFTYSIYLEHLWVAFFDFLRTEFYIGGISIQIWQILSFLWSGGVVFLFLRNALNYWRYFKRINLLEKISEGNVEKFYDRNRLPELKRLKIILFSGVTEPFLIGIRHPIIVLPDWKWEDNELAYVLEHEILHYRNHDLALKILLDFTCTLFWWNPLFTYLKKELFQLIEIRNDLRMTVKMNAEQKKEYIDCLTKVAIRIGTNNTNFVLPFSKNNIKELKQRIDLIVCSNHCNKQVGKTIGIAAMILILSTTGFVMEPMHPLPESNNENEFWLDEHNTFLIENGDTYDVYSYVDGKWSYIFSDDKLNHFVRKTKIFKQGEKIEYPQ